MIVFDGRIVAFAISLVILARIKRALLDNAWFLRTDRRFITLHDIRWYRQQVLSTTFTFEVQPRHRNTVWVVLFFRDIFFRFYFAVIDILRVSDGSPLNSTTCGKMKLFIYHDKSFGYGKGS